MAISFFVMYKIVLVGWVHNGFKYWPDHKTGEIMAVLRLSPLQRHPGGVYKGGGEGVWGRWAGGKHSSFTSLLLSSCRPLHTL